MAQHRGVLAPLGPGERSQDGRAQGGQPGRRHGLVLRRAFLVTEQAFGQVQPMVARRQLVNVVQQGGYVGHGQRLQGIRLEVVAHQAAQFRVEITRCGRQPGPVRCTQAVPFTLAVEAVGGGIDAVYTHHETSPGLNQHAVIAESPRE